MSVIGLVRGVLSACMHVVVVVAAAVGSALFCFLFRDRNWRLIPPHTGPEGALVQSFTNLSGSTYCVLSTVPGIGDTVNKKRILF